MDGEKRWRGRVEVLLNVVSVFLISYVVVVLVSGHLRSRDIRASAPPLPLGKTVPIPNASWQKTRFTLVLAISADCGFCSASAPFYRRLLKNEKVDMWQAIAVLPQAVDVAKTYMKSKGYSVNTVYQMNLENLGVTGTPTLLLVDQSGRLQQEWIGKLSQSEENDVLQHLGSSRAEDAEPAAATFDDSSPLVTTAELVTMLGNRSKVKIVDVRSGGKFAQGHIANAVNIPINQLKLLAPSQFSRAAPVLVYCEFSDACRARGVPSLCSIAADDLRTLGYTHFRVIRDPVLLLKAFGVPITGSVQ